jgi:hypothetical protein
VNSSRLQRICQFLHSPPLVSRSSLSCLSFLTPCQPCLSLGSIVSRPWLCRGSVLFQRCFSLVSALFQPCFSLVSALFQSWIYFVSYLVLSWLSLVSALSLSGICLFVLCLSCLCPALLSPHYSYMCPNPSYNGTAPPQARIGFEDLFLPPPRRANEW